MHTGLGLSELRDSPSLSYHLVWGGHLHASGYVLTAFPVSNLARTPFPPIAWISRRVSHRSVIPANLRISKARFHFYFRFYLARKPGPYRSKCHVTLRHGEELLCGTPLSYSTDGCEFSLTRYPQRLSSLLYTELLPCKPRWSK